MHVLLLRVRTIYANASNPATSPICLSVSRSVCQSVGQLVGWLVGWLDGWLVGWFVKCIQGVAHKRSYTLLFNRI